MKHIDILRALYRCGSDAELADAMGKSRPTISRIRKHGLSDAARGVLICQFLAEGRPIPEALKRPQQPDAVCITR